MGSSPSSDQIALVSQEPVLFADTIANNIAFGLPASAAGPSREAIEQAAAAANAAESIGSFPAGYNTLVRQQGSRQVPCPPSLLANPERRRPQSPSPPPVQL